MDYVGFAVLDESYSDLILVVLDLASSRKIISLGLDLFSLSDQISEEF